MRLPVLPTLIVGAAVVVMIGLGLWQLDRAAWKDALLADMGAAQSRPAVDLDATPDGARPERMTRIAVTCTPRGPAEIRAGASLSGEPGYRYILACPPQDGGGAAWLAALAIDAGWSKRPDLAVATGAARRFTGTLSELGERPLLVADQPLAPLAPSKPPSADDVPNNHRFYAVQWFFFAGAAVVIYLLALRRRRRDRG